MVSDRRLPLAEPEVEAIHAAMQRALGLIFPAYVGVPALTQPCYRVELVPSPGLTEFVVQVQPAWEQKPGRPLVEGTEPRRFRVSVDVDEIPREEW